MKKINFLKTMLMLVCLLIGVGSAWGEEAMMAAGTNGSAATVNGSSAIKVGTSRLGGDMTITVPAGATSLEFYAAAWNGVTGLSLNITPTAKVSPTSVSLTSDTGISGNSPFTLSGTESSYRFTIALSNITEETILTLTSSAAKRFVVWSATYTTSGGGSVPSSLTTMDAIFDAATAAGSTATNCRVTFDNWVVSGVKNNNAYVTDNAGKGFIVYQSGHGFVEGDILSGTVNCKVQLYNGSAEFTTLTSATDGLTVTKGGVVTPVTTVALASLSGVNTGAVLSYENLQYDGTNFTDGETNLKPYNTFVALPALVSGKNYNVTGVYIQFNTTKEIAPRTAEDFELNEVINNYTVTFAETLNGTIVVKDGETVINNGDEVAEGTTLTIECTPTDAENYRFQNWQYKEGEGSWNTRYTNPQDYTMPSANVQFKANFELIPVYTVAFSVNGAVVQSDNLKDGAAVTAPAVVAPTGKVHVGWVTTPIVGPTNVAPALVTPAPATEDVTYYAVFATQTGSGEAKYELVESVLDNWTGDYLIVYNNTYAMNTHTGNQNANTFATYTNISEYYTEASKSIASNSTTDALVYRAAQTANGYSLYCVSDDSYLGITANTTTTGAKLRWNTSYTESADDWTLGVGSVGNVGSNTLYIRWNNNSGSYRFAAYASTGQQGIQLYKKEGGDTYSDYYTVIPPAHGTLNFVASNDDGYWATFSSTENVIFDATDVVVYTVAADGDALVMMDANDNSLSCVTDKTKDEGWVAGYYVQAGVGVLINSIAESVNYYFIDTDPYISNDLNEIETDPEYNMLRAASVAMTGDYKFYKLAYGDYTNQTDLGFYYGAAGGAAFTAKEGGAYLAIPASIPAPIRYILNATDHSDVVTSIESVETSGDIVKFVSNGQIFIRVNDQIFNAQGQLIK